MDDVSYVIIAIIQVIAYILGALTVIRTNVNTNLKIKEQEKEIENLKRGGTLERNFNEEKNLLTEALHYKDVSEIRIIGTNSLSMLLICENELKKLMEKGVNVKILLLLPGTKGFEDRVNREVYYNRNSDSYYGQTPYDLHKIRLITAWNNTVMELACMSYSMGSARLYLHLRARATTPSYAMVGVISSIKKECKIYVNKYPEKGKGLHGEHFLINRSINSHQEAYKRYMDEFDNMWEHAETQNLFIDEPQKFILSDWLYEIKKEVVMALNN